MGDPVTGVWCVDCALPSAFRLQVSIANDRTGREIDRYWVQRCTRCDVMTKVTDPDT